MILQILIGVVCAAICILLVQKIYPNQTVAVWRNALVLAAVIYVGFALFTKNWEWLPIEIGGVAIYGTLAFLSKKYSHYFLAIGWAAHVLWDVLLHSNGDPDFVPSWYPGACIGFDLVIAGYLVWYFLRKKA